MQRHDDGEGGFFLIVETIADLEELEPDFRKLISPRLLRWMKKPAELAKDVERARFGALRVFAAAMSKRVVRIELHLPDPMDPNAGSVTRARFVDEARGPRAPGLVGPDPRAVAQLPASCPAPLKELYASLGAIDLARMTSGSIVDPIALASATSILDEVGAVRPEWLTEARLSDAHAFWEIDGDALCWTGEGGTLWIRRQPADWSFTPGPDIEAALDALLASLSRGEPYRP